MNYLRKYRNRYIVRMELCAAMEPDSFLISPPDGRFENAPVEYDGVYFTITSASLTEKSRQTSAGTLFTRSLEFSFPPFPGLDEFKMKFRQLSHIRLTLNTGEEIIFNKNDAAMNRPMDVEFQSTLSKTTLSTQVSSIYPFSLDES